MFGHSSLPSRIWSYGARRPIENLDLVSDQMHLAHRYRNALVERERERRARIDLAVAETMPELVECERMINEIYLEREAVRTEIKRRKSDRRTAKVDPELRRRVHDLGADLKPLRARRSDLRAAGFAGENFKTLQEEIDAEDLAIRKSLRATCGLYWGTYLMVEQSMSGCRRGAPPRFHAWNGDGKLSIQIQKGISIEDLLACRDSRLRVEVDHDRVRSGRRSVARRARLWLRVGSSGRDPIWTQVPFVMHRPLPVGSRIKWVYLIRRRRACNHEWFVQFVVERSVGFEKPISVRGRSGLEVGWRRLFHGGLRVAFCLVASDAESLSEVGAVDHQLLVTEELVIPETLVARWTKSDSIRSIRDRNFNAIRACFSSWLADVESPEWMREAARFVSQWRSPRRLAGLIVRWRRLRFAGDETGFAIFDAWRKHDRHLYEWEVHNRLKAIRQRDDVYRNFVARLRGLCAEVVVENANWRDVQRIPEAEEEDQYWSRTYARIASVGRLRQFVEESGLEVTRFPSEFTTQHCHLCGHVEAFDAGASIYHRCPNCEKMWDQDYNAAVNLLRYQPPAANAEVVS